MGSCMTEGWELKNPVEQLESSTLIVAASKFDQRSQLKSLLDPFSTKEFQFLSVFCLTETNDS